VSPATASALLALYIFGIGKAAVMPIHRWLPAAMVAPTPVSALLHAVAVVKAGVFTVLKVAVYIFGLDYLATIPATQWLLYVAAATILIASLVALQQDNLKLRLAYSTVSQLSYVVMGALLATPQAAIGGGVHIAAHAFAKITLFFCAGAILVSTHKTDVSQMRGIGWHMPLTMIAFTIGALSMIALPLTAGFISKWYILLGAFDAQHMAAVAVIVISTLLNAGYFVPVVYAAFFEAPDDAAPRLHAGRWGETPLPMLIAIGVTATGTLAFFFYADAPLMLAQYMLVGQP
jgi:multicomponent Na+:H+ antiporter subunit D